MKSSSPNRDPLLDAIFSNDELEELRKDSLNQMLLISRKSSHHRPGAVRIVMCLAGVAVIIMLAKLFWPVTPTTHKSETHLNPPLTQSQLLNADHSPKVNPGVKVLNDEELLALFPGRPVALIGPPGQQKLIFLDEPTSSNSL
jgi:hypothetical protein